MTELEQAASAYAATNASAQTALERVLERCASDIEAADIRPNERGAQRRAVEAVRAAQRLLEVAVEVNR